MDTPIATILIFDWTTESDVIELAAELVIVLGDMEDEFVVAKSDLKNYGKIKLSIEFTQGCIRTNSEKGKSVKLKLRRIIEPC